MSVPKLSPYYVRYKGALGRLSNLFDRMVYTQQGRNEIGTCEHQFFLGNVADGKKPIDFAMDLVEGATEVEFEVVEAPTGESRGTYKHLIYDYSAQFAVEQAGRKFSDVLTINTVDLKARMNLEAKNEAHDVQNKQISDVVRDVCGRNGLSPDKWESMGTWTEHPFLRQTNVTDYQFICAHLMPRIGEPCALVAGYDTKVSLQKLGSGRTYKVPAEILVRVKEQNRVYDRIKSGGGVYEVRGYDPLEKTLRTSRAGPQVSPAFGSAGPMHSGTRVEHYALHAQDGLEAWANWRNGMAGFDRYGLVVTIRGHIQNSWELPMTLDLSQCLSYRKNASQQADVAAIRHRIQDDGNYYMDFICSRSKANP